MNLPDFILLHTCIIRLAPGESIAERGPKLYPPFLIFFFVHVVFGGLLILGARKMSRLEGYELFVLTSLALLLHVLTATWPISVLVGIWAFSVLRKPDVKAAFHDELRRTPTSQGKRSRV